jgi:prevent-host-death family protein
MEEIGVRELRQHASRFLRRVAAGERFVVTDHGRPIAELAPLTADTSPWALLVRAGQVIEPDSAAGLVQAPGAASGEASKRLAAQRALEDR